MTYAHITDRRDFLRAASQGGKASCGAVLVQVRVRADREPLRLGYTTSKKLGNAVARNRARRRLRAAAQQVMPAYAQLPLDVVLIGRSQATEPAFAQLVQDLDRACRQARSRAGRSMPHPSGARP